MGDTKYKDLKDLPRVLILYLVSLLLLLASKRDLQEVGLGFFLFIFSSLIFLELIDIRSTMLKVYADSIADNKVLYWILREKLINGVMTAIISVYLAASLLLFANISDIIEILIIGISGIFLVLITPFAKIVVAPNVKPEPARMFVKIAVISMFVVIAILIDGAYTYWSPTNCWIAERFDENIPDCVIAEVHHSVLYFQHLLRFIKFLDLNISSIGLGAEEYYRFYVAKFLWALSPTPFIAYALLLLCVISFKRIVIERMKL